MKADSGKSILVNHTLLVFRFLRPTLAYVVDEARPVSVLYDLHSSDSTASIQGKALAPTWNSFWVDSLPNSHCAP